MSYHNSPAVFWSNPRLLPLCTDSFSDLWATYILGETVRAAGRESGLFLSGWHLFIRKLLSMGKPFVWFWLLSLSLPTNFLGFLLLHGTCDPEISRGKSNQGPGVLDLMAGGQSCHCLQGLGGERTAASDFLAAFTSFSCCNPELRECRDEVGPALVAFLGETV